MSETPQERAQAWCEEHAEHKSVPGTKFVSGRLLCSRDDVVKLLQPLEAEDVARLRAALEGMVNCPVGGSGQRLPTPETVARARAALRGEGEKP